MSRRRVLGVIAGALIVGGAGGYTTAAALAPVAPVEASLERLPVRTTPAAEVALPDYGAWAVGAAEGDQLYAGRRVDERLPMASITKVITALVVLQERPIADGGEGAAITLTAADNRLVGRYAAINGSVAPAPQGLTVSQRDVIELMMVQSANNYAETLALWAFGTEAAYLEAARRWLDDNGLPGITIADTTGFSSQNAATARELVRLARIAVADPVIAAAAALPVLDVAGVGRFENRNLALGSSGVDGLKTGTLRVIGSNLLFSADVAGADETVPVVGVAIGAPDQESIARDLDLLLASIVDDFRTLRLAEAGAVVARYTAPWGDSVDLRVAESVDTQVWGSVRALPMLDEAPTLQPGLPLPRAPHLTVRTPHGDVTVRLEWVGAIDPPPLAWRLQAPLDALLAGD